MAQPITPRFNLGARVQVIIAFPTGHYRTPTYIQGKIGCVRTIYGAYRNPEDLAYGKDGLPEIPLYKVSFLQKDVWGDRYSGSDYDTVCVDLYDHWLKIA